MKIKGYANYGVLSHEKQTIFTITAPHPHTNVTEKIEIAIPDGWEVSENDMGEKLIHAPNGKTYLAEEIISTDGENPILRWYDGPYDRKTKKLEWCVAM